MDSSGLAVWSGRAAAATAVVGFQRRLAHDLYPRKVAQHFVEGVLALATKLVISHFIF